MMARYLDVYPASDTPRRQRRLLRSAAVGYAVGAALLPAIFFSRTVHADVFRALPAECYQAATGMDLFQAPLVRTLLGALRLAVAL
jgi:hypothetical protein